MSKMFKWCVSAVALSLFLTLFLLLTFRVNSSQEIKYEFKYEKSLGDESLNSLYKISDNNKYYFLATDKILDEKYLGEKVEFVSSDVFWNPARCAQMKSFFTENKIFFFDTLVVNKEENQGEEFLTLLHIYDIKKNKLTTYHAEKYINIADFDKKNLVNATSIPIYLRDSNYRLHQGDFNLENLTITKFCNFFTCDILEENVLMDIFQDLPKNIKSIRPYFFQFNSEVSGQEILKINEGEKIYHFLIGY